MKFANFLEHLFLKSSSGCFWDLTGQVENSETSEISEISGIFFQDF